MEQALEGGTDRCVPKKTFRPRSYAGLHPFIIKGNLGESRKGVCYCIYMGEKRLSIFHWSRATTYGYKANQDDIRKSDAQEIKESCALSLNPKFLAADASCPPRPSQSSGAWALLQGPLNNGWYWPQRPPSSPFGSRWHTPSEGALGCRVSEYTQDSKGVTRGTDRRPATVETGGKKLKNASRAPALGQGRQAFPAVSRGHCWLGGSRSPGYLLSLFQCNNYFDLTLYVASSLLSFVYLDSFI